MNSFREQHETFLHPGDFCFASAKARIGTLLGSCVAVTVWHPTQHCGGMCHILLPSRKRPPGSLPDCRFADEAVERFVYELRARRISPESCQVKLFGGGNMFVGTSAEKSDIGRRNVDATRHALAAAGFKICCEHVGGNHRRRLYLELANGHVWMAVPNSAEIAKVSKENN